MEQKRKGRVFVGLSGGVDSSVSAYLLKKQGYDVVGAFIKIWQPEFLDACTWKEDRRSAMRVAAKLQIPFVTIDLSEEYKQGVVDYMIKEYREGKTPNPDVMCNKEIKFKAFLNRALLMGADKIATGHYAQIRQTKDMFELIKANDVAKEQSYFLWTLTQKELSKTLLPIGQFSKTEVRKIAERVGLHTFKKKDSQGLCFIGKVDFKEFLKHFIDPKKGDVLNEDGEIIGVHDGVTFLTIGERRGFLITKKGTHDAPMYVVAKDIEKNTITVAEKEKIFLPQSHRLEFVLEKTNWIHQIPERNIVYDGQVRYHQEYQKCVLEKIGDCKYNIVFEKPQTCARGQSIVVYHGDMCLGGGIIA